MSTHKCPVVPIKLEIHPNADSLSIVRIGDFSYCARTADWLNVPLGVYVEADYVVPADRPEFDFLKESHKVIENNGIKGYRIKVKKLRSIVSMGLMIPAPEGAKIGDDYREHYGIVRYEPPEAMPTGGEATKPPPGFRPVYDIENAYKYAHLFIDGEEVVASEKVHGCLPYAMQVRMADGSRVSIGKIVNNPDKFIGQEVLGLNENGQVIPSKILNVFDNGVGNKWLRIVGQRCGARKGNPYFSLYCTPDHKIYSNGEYIEACNLKKGDKVLNTRYDLELSPAQEQIILGKLLGDGTFQISGPTTAILNFSHKEDHKQYVDWTLQGLGDLAFPEKSSYVSGYGTNMIRGKTTANAFIYKKFHNFINDQNKKVVPLWVADELTPLALAFWYMDDGSLEHDKGQEDRATFAICSFSQDDFKVLQNGLLKLGIESTYTNYDYLRLKLNNHNAEKMFLFIAPYILPCMQYKLPERYRGHQGWIPKINAKFKNWGIEQIIDSVEETEIGKDRNHKFDIETETHNYFAADILVHNCNARFCCVDGAMFCGSRTEFKRQDESNLWWKALANHPEVAEFCKLNPDITVYGEVVGQVGGYNYGFSKGKVGILVFDLLRNGNWIDYDEAKVLGKSLPWVPELYRGPWNKELIFNMAEGKTTVAKASHIREGLVVKTIKERTNLEIGRTQLKIVSNTFLEKDS